MTANRKPRFDVRLRRRTLLGPMVARLRPLLAFHGLSPSTAVVAMCLATGVLIAVGGRANAQLVPIPETQVMLATQPDLRAAVHEGRLTALYGVPFATDSDPNTTTDQFVETWLFDPVTGHKDALGVADVSLALVDVLNTRNDKFRVYTYRQEIEGLPVHGSLVRIPVLLGAMDTIGYVGMRLTPNPPAALPGDVLTAQNAVDVVDESTDYGHLATFTAPEKVVFEAEAGTLHRAWRFSGYDDDESYRFIVDTNTGEIVAAWSQLLDGTVSGTVTGFATPCYPRNHPSWPNACPADNPLNPDSCPVETGMRGIGVSSPGAATVYARDDGHYDIPGLSEGQPTSVEFLLVGKWVTVSNLGGANPDIVVPVTPSVSGIDPVFNPTMPECVDGVNNPAWPHEFETALVNAFLGVQRTHDWIKGITGSTTFDVQLPAEVNAPADRLRCNAEYDAGTKEFKFYRGENECNNFATPGVVAHEYGHFIQDAMGLKYDTLSRRSFQEGFADALAAFSLDTAALGLDVRKDGLPLRDLDSPDVLLGICGSLPPWCPYCTDHHCRGLALGGAFWDLRGLLLTCAGGDLSGHACTVDADCPGEGTCTDDSSTETILAHFLATTLGELTPNVLIEVLEADDNDNNLTSTPPTPHYAEIVESFVNRHGWCDPTPVAGDDGTVHVEWDVPGPGPQPGDYVISSYATCPPDVTLQTTVSGTIPVQRWSIGRVDAQTGAALDLGTVSTSWASDVANIRVNIGSQTDATLKTRHLGAATVAREGDSHWSNLRLELEGELSGLAQPVASTNGVGGRISGTIAGDALEIKAKAVGTDEAQPASLEVGGVLYQVTVSVPLGSTLGAQDLDTRALFTGGLQGSVAVTGDIWDVSVIGAVAPTGRLTAGGDLTRLLVTGGVAGEIIAAGEIGTGDQGRIRIDGMITGNICGTNLVADQLPRPPLFEFRFGPGGTICGQFPADGAPMAPAAGTEASFAKNRYLSFVPGDTPALRAFRVKFVSLPEPFGCFNETTAWVGTPHRVSVLPGKRFTDPVPPGGEWFWAAPLVDSQPLPINWRDQEGLPVDVVHVYDERIVPSHRVPGTNPPVIDYAIYQIQATIVEVATQEGDFSYPLELRAARWGDLTGGYSATEGWIAADEIVDVPIDVLAAVACFGHAPGAPIKARCDLVGQGPVGPVGEVDGYIGLVDLLAVLGAFTGQGYPYEVLCP